ncbi:hypothetical protein [Paracoccus aminophilus]|uniref:DUF2125 domain-containing protein n=1 Tax=Paracoccus aminophilus JCM 7686 TaxID=1367847 RepID=S5YTT8_PARAH|nr:hypothetical protein [Paracoccus aminophilus]AGT08631.1 hypothetical protein JCM7686_1530 [Paracoccus aminophilus JCM 7686]
MYSRHAIAAVLALLPASAVWAAPATDDGAARLKGVFESYLSATEGVVTVKAAGDVYDLTIDPAPLLAKIPSDEIAVTILPMTYHLTDNGDGTWKVTEDQDVSWNVKVKGLQDQKLTAHSRSEGIWDESLAAYREMSGEMTNMVSDTVQYQTPVGRYNEQGQYVEPDPSETPAVLSRDHQTIERASFKTTGKAASNGGVDVVGTFDVQNVAQQSELGVLDPANPIKIGFAAPSYTGNVKIDGLQSKGILTLASWFVAHPDEDLVKAQQEDLRGKLSAALPLWDELAVDADVKTVSITSPYGNFGVDRLGVQLAVSGATPDGHLREKLSFDKLTVPEGLLPEWGVPLLPEQLNFEFDIKGFDLAAPAKMVIAAFDLNDKHDPLGKLDKDAVSKAFLPNGKLAVSLIDSNIAGKDYNIKYSADLQTGFEDGDIPTGTAKISATGLDNVQAALQAAPQELAGQPLMMLTMARALAKPGIDKGEQVWAIDATTPGVVKVNDMPIGGPGQ